MSTKHKSLLLKTSRILVAVFILFIAYRMVSSELNMRKYENAFLQVKHPENTTHVDSLDLEVNYYPATYVDDSIQFQSAFLVGQIRSYDGDWDALKTSYAGKELEMNGANILPVWAVPLQIEHNDQTIRLDFPHDFSFDPFQADILQALQDHYPSNKLTQRLGGAKRSIYFVYMFADP